MKVPVAKITILALYSTPSLIFTPITFPSSITKSVTIPWIVLRLGQFSRVFFISLAYFTLSAWALKALTAGPFLVFKTLIWTKVLSIFLPISPPKASISFTKWDLAGPPIDGLHDITPILSNVIVKIAVLAPILAELSAASHPACPAPTTITSKLCIFSS